MRASFSWASLPVFPAMVVPAVSLPPEPVVSSIVVAPSGIKAEADSDSGRRFGRIAPDARIKRTKIPNFLKMPFPRLKFFDTPDVLIFGCLMDFRAIIPTAMRRQIERPTITDPADNESEAVKRPVSDDVGACCDGVAGSISAGDAPEPESSKMIFVSGDADILFFLVYFLFLA